MSILDYLIIKIVILNLVNSYNGNSLLK